MKKLFNLAHRSPDYANLTGPNGTEDNMAGTVTECLFAPISYFTTIQDTDGDLASFTGYPDLATISTAHVFASTKGFHKMYNTQNTGSVEWNAKGDIDGFSFEDKATFFYPGMKDDFLGWMRKAKNDRFIFLFKTIDAKYIQVGNINFPAYVKPAKGGTGKSGGNDRRGFEFEVTSMSSGPILYTAAIAYHS